MGRRLAAEMMGTFWLVLGGCGAAVLAAGFPDLGIGFLGVAFAFGLTVTTMAYAVGHISGAHFNPAVTLGLWLGRRLPTRDVAPYVVAQVVAAVAACGVLYVIANGQPGFSVDESGFAANGYDEHSPGGYDLTAALVTEVVMTAAFLMVVLGVTDRRAPKGFGPLAIGLCLTLIHLISIPVTNTSVNPARSTGPALFVGDWALSQLWLFWVAPLLGAAIAGLAYRYVTGETGSEPIAETAQDTEHADVAAGDLPTPRASGGGARARSPED
ncbi:MAG: aquaporin Z [Actinomycetes bacterium]